MPVLVEVPLPVARDLAGRARCWLAERVVLGRGEWRPVDHFVGAVVVEPVLAGLEAADDPMPLGPGVSARVLAR